MHAGPPIVAYNATQGYKILMSCRNLKTEMLNASIASAYFTTSGWEPPAGVERYTFKITDWAKKSNELVRCKFEGNRLSSQHLLQNLLNPTFGFRFEAYDDGRAAPVAPFPGRAAAAEGEARRQDQAEVDDSSSDSGSDDRGSAYEVGGGSDNGEEDADSDEGEEGEEEAEEDGDEGEEEEVVAHGQLWKHMQPTGVNLDQRAGPREKPRFLATRRAGDIKELAYLLLPSQWMEDILHWTNVSILLDFPAGVSEANKTYRPLTKGELYTFIGYMLALVVEKGKAVDEMWSTTAADFDLLPPPSFGRHGMTKNRFIFLRSRIQWCCHPEDRQGAEASDPWWFVKKLIDSFNAHMAKVFSPGWLLIVDESMCAWRGRVGIDSLHSLPKLSWVPRKPEPMGLELKTTADALSSILLFIEPCMGKEVHPTQEYFSEFGHTTATTLRITKEWQGSQRVVAGDSWFASVKPAKALLGVGLHFIGDVKGAHRMFPQKALKNSVGSERGDWATMESTVEVNGEEHSVYAVGHRRHGKVHTYVFTAGTTIRGQV